MSNIGGPVEVLIRPRQRERQPIRRLAARIHPVSARRIAVAIQDLNISHGTKLHDGRRKPFPVFNPSRTSGPTSHFRWTTGSVP